MKKTVSFILISLFIVISCKNDKVSSKKEVILSDSIKISKIRFWKYLYQVEKDSILSNWDIYVSDNSKLRTLYTEKGNQRKKEISKIKRYYSPYKQRKIPSIFTQYLISEEIDSFDSNSNTHWLVYNDIIQKRRKIFIEVKYTHYLTKEEKQQFIRKGLKNKDSLSQITYQRRKQDSISFWSKYYKERKKSQNTISRVDSPLPFGPKDLEEYINKDFKLKLTNTDSLEKQKRKSIYNIWKYYLEFHPYCDEDLDKNYVPPLILPKIKTYDIIDLYDIHEIFNVEDHTFDINTSTIATRVADINGYEVYYTTTGIDCFAECGSNVIEEECCFDEYECNSTGHIVLYDRKKQHAVVIPTYFLEPFTNSIEFRFFYITQDGIIYLFDGSSDWSGVYTMSFSKSYTINILNDGSFVVDEHCLTKNEKLTKEEIAHRHEINQKHIKHYNEKRDFMIKNLKPIVSNYPYGPTLLKKELFPKEGFINDTNKTIENEYKIVLDSIIKFYRTYKKDYKYNFRTLPLTDKINKISLGNIDVWEQSLIQNIGKTTYCINIDIDSDDITDIKLPSIKNYEVYYSACYPKGILMLYDSKTQIANIINVLDYTVTTTQDQFRFFYINKNQQIEIYQGYGNYDFAIQENRFNKDNKRILRSNKGKYKIQKTHTIEVLDGGEINLIEH